MPVTVYLSILFSSSVFSINVASGQISCGYGCDLVNLGMQIRSNTTLYRGPLMYTLAGSVPNGMLIAADEATGAAAAGMAGNSGAAKHATAALIKLRRFIVLLFLTVLKELTMERVSW